MAKTEAPALRMVVERGHLVPAAAWDAERLGTYRNGSAVSVRITQEKNRKLERKYWAILHRVVETCGVKQRTAEELHRAIRYELDMVEGFSTIDGHLRIEVKSTVGMEEPEYRQFFEDAMALLRDKLNIDPETLGAEAADVGGDEDDPEPSAPPADAAAASTPPAQNPMDAAAPPSAADTGGDEDGEGDAVETAHGETVAPSSSAPSERTTRDCLNAFLRTATDEELTVIERRQTLETMKDWWKAELPSNLEFVRQCLQTCDKVAKGELKAEGARKYLEGLL